jgi:hypothetical protein
MISNQVQKLKKGSTLVCTTRVETISNQGQKSTRKHPSLHNNKGGDDFLIKKGNPKTREPANRLGSLVMHPIDKHVTSLQMISLQMEKGHNQKDCFY